jgi:proliferating cell nuclear antigen
MFQANLSDVSLLRDSLDTVSSIINEGTFLVNENGLKLIAMDPASVSMVIFDFLSSAFDSFKVEKEMHMTLNINYLVQILKRATAIDKISMKISDNKLKLKMQGNSTRTFSVPLIDEMMKEQKQPSLQFKCKLQIDPEVVKEAVKDASMVSDAVTFEASKDKFSMFTSGDSSDVRMELTKDTPSMVSIECDENSKAKYSLDYLDKMMKADKVSDTLNIYFSNDYPLKMDFKKLDKLQMSFVLAPRVETD